MSPSFVLWWLHEERVLHSLPWLQVPKGKHYAILASHCVCFSCYLTNTFLKQAFLKKKKKKANSIITTTLWLPILPKRNRGSQSLSNSPKVTELHGAAGVSAIRAGSKHSAPYMYLTVLPVLGETMKERKKLGSQEETEKRRIFVNRYPNE